MTAESDIAAIADAGANTPGDVRTALTSVLARADLGFNYFTTEYYTANDTFTKADYAGLKAIRVRMVGGGGAGGGSATTGAGLGSFGNGGNGGSFAEAWILAADLAATEAITVGAGGTGASGTTGGTGGDSIFDTISGEVRAAGGVGGATAAASATSTVGTPGSNGSSTGDFTLHGGRDCSGWRPASGADGGWGGAGGSSQYAGATHLRVDAVDGVAGLAYGGGGTGTYNNDSQGSARTGGNGAAGIVIVEVYI